MPAPKNLFKQALQDGRVQYGCWVGMADPYAAEIAGTAGFDWLLIDGEHAPNDLRSILGQVQALAGSSSHPVVRLPLGDARMIKQVMDIGVQTLLIPMVESAAQAEDLVRATRYPPQGYRGVGSALARASRFSGIPDYLPTANGEVCLLVQVENRAGLAALDDILAVEGVDGVFIGPSDLAADMGHLGNPGAPEVVDAVLDALRRIKAVGKAPGILTVSDSFIQQSEEAGATFIAVGIDVTLFAKALRDLAGKFKG